MTRLVIAVSHDECVTFSEVDHAMRTQKKKVYEKSPIEINKAKRHFRSRTINTLTPREKRHEQCQGSPKDKWAEIL